MHLAFYDSLPPARGLSQVLRRYPDDGDSQLVVPIVIAVATFSVFIPLFYFMYKSWRWEQGNMLKNKPAAAPEEGNTSFQKAELSGDSSVIIHEMDNTQETQELPEKKEGLSHELPASTALPQELPAALHEMPAGECDEKDDEATQSKILASKPGEKKENM
ncbi:hypothetical protein F4803DRAFT_570603 [Xylaria telfairii]|nr:hypothetical protein F4803DRAFT_570603 [Xylaria telfairii]